MMMFNEGVGQNEYWKGVRNGHTTKLERMKKDFKDDKGNFKEGSWGVVNADHKTFDVEAGVQKLPGNYKYSKMGETLRKKFIDHLKQETDRQGSFFSFFFLSFA